MQQIVDRTYYRRGQRFQLWLRISMKIDVYSYIILEYVWLCMWWTTCDFVLGATFHILSAWRSSAILTRQVQISSSQIPKDCLQGT